MNYKKGNLKGFRGKGEEEEVIMWGNPGG